jgi:ribosomal protein S20
MRFEDFFLSRNITALDEIVLRDIAARSGRFGRKTDPIFVPMKKKEFSPTHLEEMRYERAVRRVVSETSTAVRCILVDPLENPKKMRPEHLAKMREIIDSLAEREVISRCHADRMKRELDKKLNEN